MSNFRIISAGSENLDAIPIYVRVCWPGRMFVDEVFLVTSKTQLFQSLPLRRLFAAMLAMGATVAMVIVGLFFATPAASAAPSTVDLGTATSFAVLAGTTVTNTNPSVISGDLGVSPGTAVTGFPPGVVTNGTIHAADAVAAQAQADLTTAYNDAAGRTPPTEVLGDLTGRTLVAGVYKATSALALNGTVTLDAQNNPNAVFIFQAGSTLITASNSTVNLINGVNPCNVFFQVGSSATLGTNTTFVGSILALTSATVQTGTTVSGRILARNGQVSLDTNTINRPNCSTTPTTTSSTTTTTPVTTTTSAGSGGPGGAGNGGTTTTPPVTTTTTSAGSGGPGGAGNGGTTTTPPVTTTTTSAGNGGGPGGAGNGGTTTTPPVTTTTTNAGNGGPGGAGSGGPGGASSGAPGSGGSGGSGGSAGSSGSAAGGPGGAGSGGPVVGQVIPLGQPETGAGGASHSRNNLLLGLGVLALAGAAGTIVPDVRRRRLSASSGPAGHHRAGR